MGYVLEGSSWVKNRAVRCSVGSTKKKVLAAPPQANSPSDASTRLATGSSVTEKPRPKPTPSKVVSANKRATDRFEVAAAREVVARHVAHGARAEDADSVELATSAQHLGEAIIVPRGRDQSAAARQAIRRSKRLVG